MTEPVCLLFTESEDCPTCGERLNSVAVTGSEFHLGRRQSGPLITIGHDGTHLHDVVVADRSVLTVRAALLRLYRSWRQRGRSLVAAVKFVRELVSVVSDGD